MRVKEILHEYRILQEQLFRLGLMLKYAASMADGMSGYAKQALAYFSKALVGKPNAADELAKGWIRAAEILKVAPDEAISAGYAAGQAAKIDKATLDQAVKIAEQLALKSTKLRIRSAAGAMEWYYGTAVFSINKLLTTIGIYGPISQCVYYIAIAYQKNEEGDPEYQGKKLQYIVQWEINKCIREVAAVVIGKNLIKWALSPIGIQALGPLGWGPIGKAFNMLNPAAQATFMAWFLSPPGQDYFVKWLTGSALIPGTGVTLPGGQTFTDVTDIANALTKIGYDGILRQIGSDKAQEPPMMPDAPAWKSRAKYDAATGQRLDPR